MASIRLYKMASTYSFTLLGITAANATIDVINRENLIERGISLGNL
jgi:ornithine--oxo-acid transaminase